MLTNDLAASRQDPAFSNQFAETSGACPAPGPRSKAPRTRSPASTTASPVWTQNQVLDQRAAALSNAIASLNAQIAETQQKLADSETNNTFLEKELQRQTAARAELESKFNNLTVVRAQVKKLKDDLVVARRLQWMREGTDPSCSKKAAQLLMQRTAPAPLRPPHYDLNVEVSSDGSIRVIPVADQRPRSETNSPAP